MKTTHILNAASNLLGIALLIITGLHITNQAHGTIADEIAWVGAVLFSLSCLFSYQAIRSETRASLCEMLADRVFLLGICALLASVTVLAWSNVR
ncbi:MAG TPA: hypothetical protein VF509_02895 [Sphingobium sp.]